jgi:hypothetical protein
MACPMQTFKRMSLEVHLELVGVSACVITLAEGWGRILEANLIFPIVRQKVVYIHMHPSFLSFAEKNTRATNL